MENFRLVGLGEGLAANNIQYGVLLTTYHKVCVHYSSQLYSNPPHAILEKCWNSGYSTCQGNSESYCLPNN